MPGKLRKPSVVACVATLAAVLAVSTAGCGGDDVTRSVDATVELDVPESVPQGSPFDIGYTWTPADDFEPPSEDYRIFVHFVDPDGNIVAQDDHYPPSPTTQWVAGEPVTYRHWVYPDPGLRPDYFDFYVGMYDDAGQVATLHDGRLQNRPLVHSTVIRADDASGIPVTVDGFQDDEASLTAEDPYLREWQWMGKEGIVAFSNPHGDAILHLRSLSPVDYLEGATQSVTIRVGDREVASFEATDSTAHLRRFEIPAGAFGDGDWIDFTIEVDKVFVPAEVVDGSDDIRELGLQVFWMYLQR